MIEATPYLQGFLDYIENTGGNPSVVHFDEDWEPIGHLVRADMEKGGLIRVQDGVITDITKEERT